MCVTLLTSPLTSSLTWDVDKLEIEISFIFVVKNVKKYLAPDLLHL